MTYPEYGRDQWALLHPSFAPLTLPVGDIFWHHDVFVYQQHWDPAVMRRLEAAEIARGGYIALAYHEHILGDGTQVEDRPATKQGGATINNNKTSLAVCVPGNYRDRDTLTLTQVDSVGDWIAKQIRLGRARRDVRVRPHSDMYPTACPSDQVRWWITNGIYDIIGRKLSQLPTPAPAPSPVDWEAVRAYVIARAKVEVAQGPILRYQQPMLHGEEVRWWQHALAVTMKAPVEADGYFGTISRQWTMNWQRFWKISVDGIVGPQSRRTMVFNLEHLQ